MKAVVTGGAGFIGSHLVDRLLAEGTSVVVIDDFSSGKPANLAHHAGSTSLQIVRDDLSDPDRIARILEGSDIVYHFAAFADLRGSLGDHSQDLRINLLGMIHLLEALARRPRARLVYASTSSLYGEATVTPTPENYGPIVTSLYGASKLAAEAFAEAYTKFTDLRLWTFRFSNVVGERCRRGVIWDFVHKLRQNPTELEILGDGNQSKEFLYVGDCVDGIRWAVEHAHEPVNKFNLAVETNLTPNDVANIVIDEMGLESVRRRYSGGRGGWIGDNPVVELDTSRIRGLGWEPRVRSEDAVRRTARWILDSTPA